MAQPHSDPERTVPLGGVPYPQPQYVQPEYTQPEYLEPERPEQRAFGELPYPQPPYPQSPYARSPYAQPYPQPYAGQPGYAVQPVDPRQQAYQNSLYAAQRSRVAAGLLAIFLGTLGIHSFYLGRTGIGVLQLLLSVLSLGLLSPLVWIWTLVEGILILTGSPSYATDARGIPLRD